MFFKCCAELFWTLRCLAYPVSEGNYHIPLFSVSSTIRSSYNKFVHPYERSAYRVWLYVRIVSGCSVCVPSQVCVCVCFSAFVISPIHKSLRCMQIYNKCTFYGPHVACSRVLCGVRSFSVVNVNTVAVSHTHKQSTATMLEHHDQTRPPFYKFNIFECSWCFCSSSAISRVCIAPTPAL